jgi:hypothetical protein
MCSVQRSLSHPCHDLPTAEFRERRNEWPTERHLVTFSDAVNLKNVLGLIDADGCNLHGVAPLNWSFLTSAGRSTCTSKPLTPGWNNKRKDTVMPRRLTTNEWLAKAEVVHGSHYDYSRVVYVGGREKVEIGCPEHGWFWKMPETHLTGQGCQKCGKEKLANSRRIKPEDWIERFRAEHGEKYDYSRAQFEGIFDPIAIGCPVHGWFEQTPQVHQRGGCTACGRKRTENARRLSHGDRVVRCQKVHGDRYDYPDLNVSNAHELVTIICREHGPFTQMS